MRCASNHKVTLPYFSIVIPAQAGIQVFFDEMQNLDPGLRQDDKKNESPKS